MQANYQTATDVFDQWREELMRGEKPTLFPVGTGALARIEIGPKLVTLIGGAPGAGKTAFVMQSVIDALRLTDTLKALVCNIEMPASVLLDRQLARLSGINASDIRYRNLDEKHGDRLEVGMATLESVTDRLCFLRPPFTLDNVAAAADAFGAQMVVLDYIQRISPPGVTADRRGSVDATMNYVRQFADAGMAMIVVAAVSRQKDQRGRSSYSGDALSLASFRESSELEFGADDAFILCPDTEVDSQVNLRHLKARHTDPQDIALHFDRRTQRFTPAAAPPVKSKAKVQAALKAHWSRGDVGADGEGQI